MICLKTNRILKTTLKSSKPMVLVEANVCMPLKGTVGPIQKMASSEQNSNFSLERSQRVNNKPLLLSCHEHRRQSPRQKRGHRKEDVGTHINWKDIPKVILLLYLQVASEHLQTAHLHSLPWIAFGSELSSPNSFH